MYPFDPASNKTAALWGDSLTYQLAPYLRLGTLFQVFNLGIGGDTSIGIRTRFEIAPPEQVNADAIMIWAGRNNYSSMDQVKSDVARMVVRCPSNFIVLAVLNGSFEPYPVTGYLDITGLNSDLAATYGNRYWDVRSYRVSKHDQSAQDLTDVANDVVPTSLRSDAVHLNAAGYALVAAGLKDRLGL